MNEIETDLVVEKELDLIINSSLSTSQICTRMIQISSLFASASEKVNRKFIKKLKNHLMERSRFGYNGELIETMSVFCQKFQLELDVLTEIHNEILSPIFHSDKNQDVQNQMLIESYLDQLTSGFAYSQQAFLNERSPECSPRLTINYIHKKNPLEDSFISTVSDLIPDSQDSNGDVENFFRVVKAIARGPAYRESFNPMALIVFFATEYCKLANNKSPVEIDDYYFSQFKGFMLDNSDLIVDSIFKSEWSSYYSFIRLKRLEEAGLIQIAAACSLRSNVPSPELMIKARKLFDYKPDSITLSCLFSEQDGKVEFHNTESASAALAYSLAYDRIIPVEMGWKKASPGIALKQAIEALDHEALGYDVSQHAEMLNQAIDHIAEHQDAERLMDFYRLRPMLHQNNHFKGLILEGALGL